MTNDENIENPTREQLWDQCQRLARSQDVLAEVEKTAVDAGFAGSTAILKLTYLSVPTRFFDRPVSIALRGESAAGKSYTIKLALAFHPAEAVVTLTAMSDKALAYFDEDLAHRMLVVYEGSGLVGEHLTYFVRSLLSEGRLDYLYTDFEHKTVVRLEKEGPTGLITSTAGIIDYELATRLFSATVDDSPELTKAIMMTEGRAAEGVEFNVDYTEYHALQGWIAAGRHEVVVPFGSRLAEQTNERAVRLRRDFGAVIGLTKAHALLHQHNREEDEQSRIVALVEDYAAVHALVSETVAEGAEATVPESIRETVEAVFELEYPRGGPQQPVTIAKLVERLGLSRPSVTRRVKRALGMGFLKDDGIKGGPRLLRTYESMPTDAGVLPDPSILE